MSRKQNTHDEKRTILRNKLWPGSCKEIWDFSDPALKGFATMTRLMPLVMHLIKILAPKKRGDPGTVYLELWCRDFGQGLVQIIDEQDCAYASGYTSTRALRTWQGHMLTLVELGFIKTKKKGNREYSHVLLRDPLRVCAELNAAQRVPDEWWTAFIARAEEIKADIPEIIVEQPQAREKPTLTIKRA